MTAVVERWPLVGRSEHLETFARVLGDGPGGGVLFHGPAGVGKTRLAEECAARAEQQGHRVLRAVASEAAATLPLGAVAHLLPAELVEPPSTSGRISLGAPDALRVFESARQALAVDGDRTPVLFVDELHLLDAASATLISQLLVDGRVLLLGTVRTGPASSDAATDLWRDHTTRIDLANLSREGVDTLLHLALGGPLDGKAGLALWEASEGNVLYLRELVVGAVQSDALQIEDGVWRLTGRLTASSRLAELVGARLHGLDDESQRVLEVVALCEPMGLSELERIAELTVLEHLERALVLRVTNDGRRTEVRTAHPLQGEVTRAEVPALRRRAILRAHIERIEHHGARRRDDALRVAAWRLDIDGTADHDLLVRAATIARYGHDFAQVVRLARPAFDATGSPTSALLLGEALYEQGSFAESEAVLAAGETTLHEVGPDPDEVEDHDRLTVQLADVRSKNLLWGLLDPEAALSVIFEAKRLVEATGAHDELLAEEAAVHMFAGRPDLALGVIDGLPDTDVLRARVIRAIAASPALSAAGRTAEAIQVAEEGFEDHSRLGDEPAIAHPGTHIVNQVFALTDAGRLDEAEQLARAGYDITVADGSLIAQIWFALNLGRISLLRGRVATARRWSQEGVAVARATGFTGPLHLALAGSAVASSGRGQADDAARTVAELDALPGFGFLHPELALGRAWSAVAAGDLAEARRLLEVGAAEAAATGHVLAESWLLHDVARLGDPAAVTDRLAALAGGSDSELVTVRARHAAALASGDAEALRAVAEELEGLGLLLAAAEAATSSAEAWKRQGEQRKAAQQQVIATDLLGRCEGASSPGTMVSESIVPLSKREREVGLLAAQGVASKEIADRLFLSVRTVNNHLQRVYTKLGVTSRAELADALARSGGPPDEGGARG